MKNSQLRSLVVVVFLLALGIMTWSVLTIPDQRTPGEKIGDAVDAMPQGLDKAVRQLEDRTPGERLGDAIKDSTSNP